MRTDRVSQLGLLVARGLACGPPRAPAVSSEERAAASESAGPAEQTARRFMGEITSGRYAQAFEHFGPQIAAVMPPDKLKVAWEDIAAHNGGLRGLGAARIEPTPQGTLVDLDGDFATKHATIRVVVDGQSKIVGFFVVPVWEAPDYAERDAFDERPITVTDGDVSLPGFLCMPKGTGPFPAAVLVHGSGPNDADETFGPNKPLKDLAWGLASRKIAVLRYHKRTYQYRGARSYPTVKEEAMDDARTALGLLEKTPGIDRTRLVVIGHSLGAMLAPRIAAMDPRVSAVVLLAGKTRPYGLGRKEQVRYIIEVQNQKGEDVEKARRQVEAAAERIDAPDLRADENVDGSPGGYWLDLRENPGTKFARGLEIPILVLQGERDYQVTMADFAGWKTLLEGEPRATLKSYPALNHLFQPGTGKSRPDEYGVPGHVAKEVIDDVARWIAERVGPK